MEETKVSSKYQIVIPKAIRDRANIEAGQKLTVILKGNVISLVPQVPLEELRGFISGIDTKGLREEEDRL